MSGNLSLGGVLGRGVEGSPPKSTSGHRPQPPRTKATKETKATKAETPLETGTGVEESGQSTVKRHSAVQRLAMLRAVLIFRKKLDGKRTEEEGKEAESLPMKLSDLMTSLAFCTKLKVRIQHPSNIHSLTQAHIVSPLYPLYH
jgi:hypothetical protein